MNLKTYSRKIPKDFYCSTFLSIAFDNYILDGPDLVFFKCPKNVTYNNLFLDIDYICSRYLSYLEGNKANIIFKIPINELKK